MGKVAVGCERRMDWRMMQAKAKAKDSMIYGLQPRIMCPSVMRIEMVRLLSKRSLGG
jgi:hypothetical protein